MKTLEALFAKILQRLKDEKAQKYSLNILLDTANAVFVDLNREFKLNICKFKMQMSPENNIFTAPTLYLSFEKAFLNDKELKIKKYDERAKNLQIAAFSNFQSLVIQPSYLASGELEIYLNMHLILALTTKIYDYLENALIYGVLKNLFEIEHNVNNLERVLFYEKLFNEEKNRLRALIADTREARAFESPCIMV